MRSPHKEGLKAGWLALTFGMATNPPDDNALIRTLATIVFIVTIIALLQLKEDAR